MAIESEADFAAFFDLEEFGVLIFIDGGQPFGALLDQDSEEGRWGESETVVGGNVFLFPITTRPAPLARQTITLVATGERFEILGDPMRVENGTMWRCSGAPL